MVRMTGYPGWQVYNVSIFLTNQFRVLEIIELLLHGGLENVVGIYLSLFTFKLIKGEVLFSGCEYSFKKCVIYMNYCIP